MDEERLEKLDRIHRQSKVNALISVNKMDLPKVLAITDESFFGLGLKVSRDASQNLKRLREAHGVNLPYLIGLSLREIWFALCNSASYYARMMAAGEVADNDYTQKFKTPKGYGEMEGIAWTLYNELINLEESQQQATFRNGTPFQSRLSLEDILNGAALYWFSSAAISHQEGDIEGAFTQLGEAYDAMSLAHGDHMWDSGAESTGEFQTENSVNAETAARTALAKVAAHARHAENRSMKADVFAWLNTNMPKFKSMDAAAQAITKQQPIAFRTARDWTGEWKKLQSAGTP